MKSSHTKNHQTVTSAGNSWIICRSKSYPERIYYFNTLTGEAVWNLSAPERQKAKQRTVNQNGDLIENCPEPTEPPKELTNMNNNGKKISNDSNDNSPSTVYNKQIINNQFPKQGLPPYTAFIPAQCLQACSTLGSQNSEAIGLNVPPQSYASNLWAMPPQLFLAPNVQSIQNQALRIACNNFRGLNDQTLTLSHQNNYQMYGNVQSSSNFKHNQFNRYSRGNKRGNWQRHNQFNNQRKLRTSTRNVDLRQKLRAKRYSATQHEPNESADFEYHQNEDHQTVDEHQNVAIQHDTSHEDTTPNVSDEAYNTDCENDWWLEENIHVQGSKLTLDVTNLIALARQDFDPDCWYIAVDKSILLGHLNFLDILLNSDEQCHLMVSRQEYVQLQSGTGSPRILRRISRAKAFVSQRVDAGTAVIADQLNDIDDKLPHVINCCLHLQEQYYHVVLLSNDIELQKFKNDYRLSIFTIKDLKHFLSQSVNNKEASPEKVYQETRNQNEVIKITIENDTTSLSNEIKSPIRCKTMQQLIYQSDTVNESNMIPDTAISQTATTPPKIDEVKTDPPPPKKMNSDTYERPTQTITNIDKDKQTNSSSKIRLKRSTSNQTSHCSSNDSNKKQFRWRKSRHHSNQNENSNIQNASKETSNNSHQDHCENYMNHTHESNESLSRENDRSHNDFVEGSESCSSILRNFSDIVVIEETSTSGIISNSTGNVESDFDTTPLYRSSSNVRCSNKEPSNEDIVMFEITDKYMEENLRVRCDEWVSRFVQIMEEVCSQILQQDKLFLPLIMPPPWTMQQAITCIGVKFDSHKEVSDAANMLLQVLCRISDRDGRISTEPKNYMEMYSYGVHLVEGLQSVLNNNEDVQTAMGLLTNLLNDIQYAELLNNDNFGDHLQESTKEQDPKNSSMDTVEDPNKDQETPTKAQLQTSKHSSPSTSRASYNLRSTKGITKDQQQSPQKVQFIRTIDKKYDFLLNLELKKKANEQIQNETNMSMSTENSLPVTQKSSEDINVDGSPVARKESIFNKFARSFVKNIDYEEKLNRNVQTRNTLQVHEKKLLDMDVLDYNEENDYGEYENDNNDECYEYADLETNSHQTDHENELADFSEDGHELVEARSENQNEDKHEVNNEIENVYSTLFAEIKSVFSFVKRFCVNFQKDLDGFCSSHTQQETLKKAEKAQLYIGSIIKSLNGKHRWIHNYGIFNEPMIKEGLVDTRNVTKQGMISRDDEQHKYKEMAMKTMMQADTLLKAVDIIVDAVKS